MIGDLVVIRVVILGVATLRVVLTSLIHLGRGELLERNRCRNRLCHIVVHCDGDLDRTRTRLRRKEGLLTLTNHAAGLVRTSLTKTFHQLRVQRIALTRDQAGVSHSIDNNRARLDLGSTILELGLSLNRRHPALNHKGLRFIARVLVLDHRAIVHRRVLWPAKLVDRRLRTLRVIEGNRLLKHNVRRARLQPFNITEFDDSRARAVLGSGDINGLHIAYRGHILAFDQLQLPLKPVLLASFEALVRNGVLDAQALADCLRLHGHGGILRRRYIIHRNIGGDCSRIDGNDLCRVIRVRVLSHKLFGAKVVEVETFKHDRIQPVSVGGDRNLHYDRTGNRVGERTYCPILVWLHGDGDWFLVVRRVRVRATYQLTLQRVLHTRDEAIKVNLVVNSGCRRSSRNPLPVEAALF